MVRDHFDWVAGVEKIGDEWGDFPPSATAATLNSSFVRSMLSS
jgi:hypothetical protein